MVVPTSWGEPGVEVVGAGGGGAIGVDEPGAGVVVPCSIGEGVEVFCSSQRVQVVMVLVIRLVFTMMEVLPLMTVVEVTGQLVKVV